MLLDILERFRDYIKKYRLIVRDDSVLLGVSGGPDSLAMLDLFSRIKEELNLELVVFHLNHMFRKEAREEAEFVASTAGKYGLQCLVEQRNVPELVREQGLSPEEAAREVRLQLLLKWAENLQIKRIGLAHNKDDQVETIFLNLIRGTGLKGLGGIEPVSEFESRLLIHPLLDIFRQEIEEYCRERGLKPVQDPTNKEAIYSRNKLRLKIIPYLERQINPGVKEAVSRMGAIIREEEAFLEQTARERYQVLILDEGDRSANQAGDSKSGGGKDVGGLHFSLKGLKETPPVLRRRLYRLAVKKLKGNAADLYAVHYRAIDGLVDEGRSGKLIELKDNLCVKRQYEHIIFTENKMRKEAEPFSYRLNVPGEIELPEGERLSAECLLIYPGWREEAGPEVCFCDADRVKFPLIIRSRKPGDRFHPLGMGGSKKLKDFFIDEKVPPAKREQIPLVFDSSDRLIWVVGCRTDNRFRVREGSEELLKIVIKRGIGD